MAATPAFAHQGRGARQGPSALAMLYAADTNGDGAVTRAEAQAARALMFQRLDTNDDGYLSEADRDGAVRRDARPRPRRADTNNDGRISRDEMMSQPYRGFDRIDSNHDDVISAEELAVVRSLTR